MYIEIVWVKTAVLHPHVVFQGFYPNEMEWKYLNGAPSLPLLKSSRDWNKESLKALSDAHNWVRKMLVIAKLCLSNAQVNAEYALPDEMVEEVAKYVCPIKRRRGEEKWMFSIEDAGDAIFDIKKNRVMTNFKLNC